MSYVELKRSEIEKLQKNLDKITEIDSSSIGRREELSPELNFEDLIEPFKDIQESYRYLVTGDLRRVSNRAITSLNNSTNRLLDCLLEIDSFSLKTDGAPRRHGQIYREFDEAINDASNALMIPTCISVLGTIDIEKYRDVVDNDLNVLKARTSKANADLNRQIDEGMDAIQRARDLASQQGVDTEAATYIKSAGNHGKDAKKWLVASIALTVLTVGLAAVFFYISLTDQCLYLANEEINQQNLSTTKLVQLSISKLVLMSTLSFVLFLCARNYKSHKHNETLYQHRANSLKTFRTFVAGTSDQRIKDAILLHAAQAAFGNRLTGYESRDSDTQAINPIVEILGKQVSNNSGA